MNFYVVQSLRIVARSPEARAFLGQSLTLVQGDGSWPYQPDICDTQSFDLSVAFCILYAHFVHFSHCLGDNTYL